MSLGRWALNDCRLSIAKNRSKKGEVALFSIEAGILQKTKEIPVYDQTVPSH